MLEFESRYGSFSAFYDIDPDDEIGIDIAGRGSFAQTYLTKEQAKELIEFLTKQLE
jgi:hypothetical protein